MLELYSEIARSMLFIFRNLPWRLTLAI